MNIATLLERAARVHGNRTGLALGAREFMSYRGWWDASRGLAGWLGRELGPAPGAHVAIVARNQPEYLVAQWAAWIAGAVAVPVNAKLHVKEFAYILDHSEAAAVFVSPDLDAVVAEAAPDLRRVVLGSAEYEAALEAEPAQLAERGRDDLAWLFYTSGTTGQPKGAMLSHGNLLAMTASYFADIEQVRPGDAILHAAPLSHGSGCYVLPHVAAGAANVIPETGGFEPAEIFGLIAAWRGVSMFAAPTMVKRLVEAAAVAGPDLANLKSIIYGGAPMHVADVKRALDVIGPRLAQLYGQGEAPMCITGLARAWYAERDHPRFEARIGSAGFPQTVVEVAVLGPDERPLNVGETGEVAARGAPVMKGYWRNPDASAETLRGGWLHTGDIGRFDEEGFLTLLDRSKDVIISGGANIYPREVEEALLAHPGVSECAVIGAPHDDWGEEVVAFVVPRSGGALGPSELDAHCQAEIARFKRPKRYVFLEVLPKNNYGKILKRDLRSHLSSEERSRV